MSKQFTLPDKTKIPKQTYAMLFSEVVQYCHQKVESLDQFSTQLAEMGKPIGCSILEVLQQSSTTQFKRTHETIPMLVILKDKIWPVLFGYAASKLEQQVDDANCYMLYDETPKIIQYISHPQDIKQAFTCCSFVGGIIEGILCSARFPCKVTAHPNPTQGNPDGVVYLIKFLDK